MIKFMESLDSIELGRVQSLLEANGIRTFMKGEFFSGVLGGLPSGDFAPQLFLLNEEDLPRAKELLED